MFKFLGPLLTFLSKLLDFGSDVRRDRKKEKIEEEKKEQERQIKEDPLEWFNKNFSSQYDPKKDENQKEDDDETIR